MGADAEADRKATAAISESLEQKRNQPWANRVKEVQAFVASRTNTGSPAASVCCGPATAPVAANWPHMRTCTAA